MAKKVLELDTPYRVGEKVVAMRDLGPVPAGTPGKVTMVNGLSSWIRYWVRFDGGHAVGQVDHGDLARPSQTEQWRRHQEEAAAAAAAPPAEAEPAAEPAAVGAPSGASTGIPEHLLERSRAAKARKLGG